MPTDTKFQKRLLELVEETEMKRVDIAKAGNIDYRALSSALIYGIIPTTKTLIKLANFFNVSMSYLLARSENNDYLKPASQATFKERFELLCKQKGVSHYKVAQDCFFDKSNINGWIYKGYIPALEIIDILSNYFNVSIDYLLGRID